MSFSSKNRSDIIKKIVIILALFGITSTFVKPSTINATGISFSIGRYDPYQGVLHDLFEFSPVRSFRFEYPYYDHFDWIASFKWVRVKAKWFDLEKEATSSTFNMGFQKQFFPDEQALLQITPMFGAGVGIIKISSLLSNGSSDSDDSNVQYSTGTYTEVGLNFCLAEHYWIETRLIEQRVHKKVLGNINLGGTIALIGLKYIF